MVVKVNEQNVILNDERELENRRGRPTVISELNSSLEETKFKLQESQGTHTRSQNASNVL